MKKRLIYIAGAILVIICIVVLLFAFLDSYIRTPIMRNVTNVYLDFAQISDDKRNHTGERTRIKITDNDDKNYLIKFFNSQFELGDLFGCCPHWDIFVIFETYTVEHKFGLGIGLIGDPSMYYYNANTNCNFTNEQLLELLTFLLKFDEAANYDVQWLISYLEERVK